MLETEDSSVCWKQRIVQLELGLEPLAALSLQLLYTSTPPDSAHSSAFSSAPEAPRSSPCARLTPAPPPCALRFTTGAWPYCRCWGGASAPVMECPVDEGEAMMVRIPPACTGSCHPSDRPSVYPPLFYTVTGNRGNDGSFPSPAPGLYSSLL